MRRAEAGIQVDKFYPPTDWLDNNNKQIDIRKNAENNSIVLLVGHSADFTKYSLLGLLVDTSSGTYDVYIDDVLVGSGITKNTQYDIDFSTINTTYGTATTPEALVLHKVVIKPTTSGSTITKFKPKRPTSISTNQQQQGVLWCHFELSNEIDISNFMEDAPYPYNWINCLAITSKGDYIDNTTGAFRFGLMDKVRIIPRIKNIYVSTRCFYSDGKLKRIICDNLVTNSYTYNFLDVNDRGIIEQICCKNNQFTKIELFSFNRLNKLKMLPTNKPTTTASQSNITEAIALFPTKIDLSLLKNLPRLTYNGASSFPMRGLRGLKVSNEAPFTGNSPQINVNYTGLDRNALVELFQSLPTVTGGQTLSLVGATGNNLTKVGSPTIDENGVVSGFSSSNYITTGSAINLSTFTNWKLKFRFKMGAAGTSRTLVLYGANLSIFSGGGNNRIYIQLNNSSSYRTSFIYTANEDIVIEIEQKNSKIYIYANTELIHTYNFTILPNNNIFTLCRDSFDGSLYLQDCLIKTDSNYFVKGYLTDTDKAIATDKGWGLVLS